jgi:HSP20 family molecular chaperone IbpA
MKTNGSFLDLGDVFDEIFDAAQQFRSEFQNQFDAGRGTGAKGHYGDNPFFRNFFTGRDGDARGENVDYYPAYSYPPTNVYMTSGRELVFEFAVAGFEEKNISLSFQGDYMVFSAALGNSDETAPSTESIHYFKHRLKLKDIEKQKYFVPLDKYAQEKVKAVHKNGILKVTVPPKESVEKDDGVRIEIVSED